MDIQEFPVKLEELCSFSFNFENLIRIIEFLQNILKRNRTDNKQFTK